MRLVVILGNQLFSPERYLSQLENQGIELSSVVFFMSEELELATYYRFHQHKIAFFFLAMREARREYERAGFKIFYNSLKNDGASYEDRLDSQFEDRGVKIDEVFSFEVEDKFFLKRLQAYFASRKLRWTQWNSPMFLTSRSQFETYLDCEKKPFLKNFYTQQRRRLKILVDSKGQPKGGQWSFDEDNRLSLPKDIKPVSPFAGVNLKIDKTDLREVQNYMTKCFAQHPGHLQNFSWPVSRKSAEVWLSDFLQNRFSQFGPYEDALAPHSDFVYHSLLTPFLNTGLLEPEQVVRKALEFYKKNSGVPISSVEGFIRQIIGWREFIRGIYWKFSEQQEERNFFSHSNNLSSLWYSGGTGVPPLDQVIEKAQRTGFAHHIERLMVVGSLMVLTEIAPRAAHRWFMEMFIDSSDWVMGPNVYGMALFSDGGIFATKPYICGSNYYIKMGRYEKGPWCDEVDGLYWMFIEKNLSFFSQQPRLNMMVKNLTKMESSRKEKIFSAGARLKKRLTQ